MKKSVQKIIDVTQWCLIIGLTLMLVGMSLHSKQLRRDLVTSAEYNKESTYVRIYESKKLNKLKKENRELYDSISKLKDVESGMVIKYVVRHKTDTIYNDKFLSHADTLYSDKNLADIDSVYEYKEANDTVDLNVKVKAQRLKWVMADVAIRDKFMIINREKDGVNQTFINHSKNSVVESTTMWHKKNSKSFYQKFTISPQIGFGYGIFNKNIDVYVGGGISYNF